MQDILGNELNIGDFVINTYSYLRAPTLRFGVVCGNKQAWCWTPDHRVAGWTAKPIRIEATRFLKVLADQVPVDIRLTLINKLHLTKRK